jgi:molybdate transport system ATP-binding protein
MPRLSSPDSRYVEVHLERLELERAGSLVLKDVSWSIRPRERWVLVGANGAGKTQLLKLIAGSVWPTPDSQRRYVWQGESWLTPATVQDEIGYVGPERQDKYERYGWNHSVVEVVGTGLHRTDIPLQALSSADRARIRALLRQLAILPLARRRFLTLSYGERRLTLLARALAAAPGLLLLDELLNGLDPVNHARALRWLEQTSRSPMPWVLSSHRGCDIPASATHALVLEEGRVVHRGPLRGAPLARWLERAPRARRATRAPQGRVPGLPDNWLIRLVDASIFLDYRPVLLSLTLEIRSGECWVVHGRNGSGKTTLLRTLYGDHGVAHGGVIRRAGIEPGVPLEVFRRRVGFVAAHLQAGHPQHLTVAEVVQSGRHASIGLNEPATRSDRAAARRALAALGLTTLGDRTLREISYGQLRRVLFARALVNAPVLLLLDEPFAGIDAPTRAALQAEIDTLTAAGTTVVMSTHHREEWPDSATHELELADGRIAYAGALREAGTATAEVEESAEVAQ